VSWLAGELRLQVRRLGLLFRDMLRSQGRAAFWMPLNLECTYLYCIIPRPNPTANSISVNHIQRIRMSKKAVPKGTIIATGAAGGIGSGWLFSHLKSPQAKLYHTIYIVHPSAPGNLREHLQNYAPSEHTYEIFPLDLSKISEVRLAATEFNKRVEEGELGRIKLLMLIAGAMFLDPTTKDGVTFTEDGIESHIAVNYLANYILILILLQSLDKNGARIIATGSTTHNPSFLSNQGSFYSKEMKILFGENGLEDLVKATEKVKMGEAFPASLRRYGRSKWCLIAFL
jgi:NAD(P)-dependent dehydrogenase (short-subunit alcohol dehydrogenase family)